MLAFERAGCRGVEVDGWEGELLAVPGSGECKCGIDLRERRNGNGMKGGARQGKARQGKREV